MCCGVFFVLYRVVLYCEILCFVVVCGVVFGFGVVCCVAGCVVHVLYFEFIFHIMICVVFYDIICVDCCDSISLLLFCVLLCGFDALRCIVMWCIIVWCVFVFVCMCV